MNMFGRLLAIIAIVIVIYFLFGREETSGPTSGGGQSGQSAAKQGDNGKKGKPLMSLEELTKPQPLKSPPPKVNLNSNAVIRTQFIQLAQDNRLKVLNYRQQDSTVLIQLESRRTHVPLADFLNEGITRGLIQDFEEPNPGFDRVYMEDGIRVYWKTYRLRI